MNYVFVSIGEIDISPACMIIPHGDGDSKTPLRQTRDAKPMLI